MNIEGLNSTGLTGTPKGLSRVSPAPQFKSINPSALRILDGPAITFNFDYWKKYKSRMEKSVDRLKKRNSVNLKIHQ